MQRHFSTKRLVVFQSMISAAVRDGLTFEAFERVDHTNHAEPVEFVEYIINYTGGY